MFNLRRVRKMMCALLYGHFYEHLSSKEIEKNRDNDISIAYRLVVYIVKRSNTKF